MSFPYIYIYTYKWIDGDFPAHHVWLPFKSIDHHHEIPWNHHSIPWKTHEITMKPLNQHEISYGGFHSHGGTPLAGWFIEKISSSNGWWLGLPPWLRKQPYKPCFSPWQLEDLRPQLLPPKPWRRLGSTGTWVGFSWELTGVSDREIVGSA